MNCRILVALIWSASISGCVNTPEPMPMTALSATAVLAQSVADDFDVVWIRGVESGGTLDGMLGPRETWEAASVRAGEIFVTEIRSQQILQDRTLLEGAISTWAPIDLDLAMDSDRIADLALNHFGIASVAPGWSLRYWLYQTPSGPEWLVSLLPQESTSGEGRAVVFIGSTGSIASESNLSSITFSQARERVDLPALDSPVLIEAAVMEADAWYLPLAWASPVGGTPNLPDDSWGDGSATVWHFKFRNEENTYLQMVSLRSDGGSIVWPVEVVDKEEWDGQYPYENYDLEGLASLPTVELEAISSDGLFYQAGMQDAKPVWGVVDRSL